MDMKTGQREMPNELSGSSLPGLLREATTKSRFWRGFTEGELEILGESLTILEFDNQLALVDFDELSDCAMLILSGEASVYARDISTNAVARVARLSAGQIFGELAIYDEEISEVKILSDSANTACVKISLAEILQIQSIDAALGLKLLRVLTQAAAQKLKERAMLTRLEQEAVKRSQSVTSNANLFNSIKEAQPYGVGGYGLGPNGLTDAEIAALARRMYIARFAKGEKAISNHTLANSVMLVVEGSMRIKIGNRVLASRARGEFIGEDGFTAQVGVRGCTVVQRIADVVCASDCAAVAVLSREHMLELARESPLVACKLFLRLVQLVVVRAAVTTKKCMKDDKADLGEIVLGSPIPNQAAPLMAALVQMQQPGRRQPASAPADKKTPNAKLKRATMHIKTRKQQEETGLSKRETLAVARDNDPNDDPLDDPAEKIVHMTTMHKQEMMATETVQLLSSVQGIAPYWFGFNDEELWVLAGMVSIYKCPKSTLLYTELDSPDRIVLMLRGMAKVTRNSTVGRKVLGALRPGEVAGEMACFYEGMQRTSAISVTDETFVAVFTFEKIAKSCLDSPRVAMKLLVVLMATCTAELRTWGSKHDPDSEDLRFGPINVQQADLLGMLETVYQKTHRLGYGMQLVLHDLHALERYIELVEFEPGTQLIHAGQSCNAVLMILTGKAMIFEGGKTGTLHATLSKGQFLGETEFIVAQMHPYRSEIAGERPYDVFAGQHESLVCIMLTQEALRMLNRDRPELAYKVFMRFGKLTVDSDKAYLRKMVDDKRPVVRPVPRPVVTPSPWFQDGAESTDCEAGTDAEAQQATAQGAASAPGEPPIDAAPAAPPQALTIPATLTLDHSAMVESQKAKVLKHSPWFYALEKEVNCLRERVVHAYSMDVVQDTHLVDQVAVSESDLRDFANSIGLYRKTFLSGKEDVLEFMRGALPPEVNRILRPQQTIGCQFGESENPFCTNRDHLQDAGVQTLPMQVGNWLKRGTGRKQLVVRKAVVKENTKRTVAVAPVAERQDSSEEEESSEEESSEDESSEDEEEEDDDEDESTPASPVAPSTAGGPKKKKAQASPVAPSTAASPKKKKAQAPPVAPSTAASPKKKKAPLTRWKTVQFQRLASASWVSRMLHTISGPSKETSLLAKNLQQFEADWGPADQISDEVPQKQARFLPSRPRCSGLLRAPHCPLAPLIHAGGFRPLVPVRGLPCRPGATLQDACGPRSTCGAGKPQGKPDASPGLISMAKPLQIPSSLTSLTSSTALSTLQPPPAPPPPEAEASEELETGEFGETWLQDMRRHYANVAAVNVERANAQGAPINNEVATEAAPESEAMIAPYHNLVRRLDKEVRRTRNQAAKLMHHHAASAASAPKGALVTAVLDESRKIQEMSSNDENYEHIKVVSHTAKMMEALDHIARELTVMQSEYGEVFSRMGVSDVDGARAKQEQAAGTAAAPRVKRAPAPEKPPRDELELMQLKSSEVKALVDQLRTDQAKVWGALEIAEHARASEWDRHQQAQKQVAQVHQQMTQLVEMLNMCSNLDARKEDGKAEKKQPPGALQSTDAAAGGMEALGKMRLQLRDSSRLVMNLMERREVEAVRDQQQQKHVAELWLELWAAHHRVARDGELPRKSSDPPMVVDSEIWKMEPEERLPRCIDSFTSLQHRLQAMHNLDEERSAQADQAHAETTSQLQQTAEEVRKLEAATQLAEAECDRLRSELEKVEERARQAVCQVEHEREVEAGRVTKLQTAFAAVKAARQDSDWRFNELQSELQLVARQLDESEQYRAQETDEMLATTAAFRIHVDAILTLVQSAHTKMHAGSAAAAREVGVATAGGEGTEGEGEHSREEAGTRTASQQFCDLSERLREGVRLLERHVGRSVGTTRLLEKELAQERERAALVATWIAEAEVAARSGGLLPVEVQAEAEAGTSGRGPHLLSTTGEEGGDLESEEESSARMQWVGQAMKELRQAMEFAQQERTLLQSSANSNGRNEAKLWMETRTLLHGLERMGLAVFSESDRSGTKGLLAMIELVKNVRKQVLGTQKVNASATLLALRKENSYLEEGLHVTKDMWKPPHEPSDGISAVLDLELQHFARICHAARREIQEKGVRRYTTKEMLLPLAAELLLEAESLLPSGSLLR
ncbi:hypothetical protein CYMTET_34481, partial [Cymbomonas tetramitiformis]